MFWQFPNGLAWWIPIAWLLAAVSIAVAVLAFRRSHYPNVRIHRLRAERSMRYPDWTDHGYLVLDLFCLGADVFDVEAYLECDYSYWQRWRRYPVRRDSTFSPVGELPNPIKKNQVVRLEAADNGYRYLKGQRYFDTRVPSQLWPGRVRIAIYHSGKRLLLSRSSWRFRALLREFDWLGRQDGDALPPYPRLRTPDELKSSEVAPN